MNGIGLAGTLEGVRAFQRNARALLRPGGTLIFDSSDISYLYDGKPPPAAGYYGELLYRYEYRRQLSDPFRWLFIDRKTLARVMAAEGWQMELLFEDKQDQYLVKCRRKSLADPYREAPPFFRNGPDSRSLPNPARTMTAG